MKKILVKLFVFMMLIYSAFKPKLSFSSDAIIINIKGKATVIRNDKEFSLRVGSTLGFEENVYFKGKGELHYIFQHPLENRTIKEGLSSVDTIKKISVKFPGYKKSESKARNADNTRGDDSFEGCLYLDEFTLDRSLSKLRFIPLICKSNKLIDYRKIILKIKKGDVTKKTFYIKDYAYISDLELGEYNIEFTYNGKLIDTSRMVLKIDLIKELDYDDYDSGSNSLIFSSELSRNGLIYMAELARIGIINDKRISSSGINRLFDVRINGLIHELYQNSLAR
ncbi:hypothetical protein [Vibrio nigripulchritudo]|uniref:hypothetical protein n=1 Tax=Vibrio nigripulchritudo TaxID=28173 RepID=UPI00066D6E77|nr:hypothetical protein [Vibrio nigripulchritudo]